MLCQSEPRPNVIGQSDKVAAEAKLAQHHEHEPAPFLLHLQERMADARGIAGVTRTEPVAAAASGSTHRRTPNAALLTPPMARQRRRAMAEACATALVLPSPSATEVLLAGQQAAAGTAVWQPPLHKCIPSPLLLPSPCSPSLTSSRDNSRGTHLTQSPPAGAAAVQLATPRSPQQGMMTSNAVDVEDNVVDRQPHSSGACVVGQRQGVATWPAVQQPSSCSQPPGNMSATSTRKRARHGASNKV